MKGVPQRGHKTIPPSLDTERFGEGSLCLATFMSECWEETRDWADLSFPHAQKIQFAWAGSARSHHSPCVQPLHCRADVCAGNNHSSAGTELTFASCFMMPGSCLGDGRSSVRWGAKRGQGTQSRPLP